MTGKQEDSVLQIDQDIAYQEREWLVQRIGWMLMLLLIVAAILGLFGSGIVSSTTRSSDGIAITYPRFGRYRAPLTLDIRLMQHASGVAQVRIARDYLEHVQIEQVTPEPRTVELDSGWVVFHFDVVASAEPLLIRFDLHPTAIGGVDGKVGSPDGATVEFGHFIYP